MNLKKAQEIIDEIIGENYVIYKTEDSEKYTFAYYKHLNYDCDDQRGRLIGVGPVVLIKETGEYKLLGSGEMVFGDYFDFNQNFEEPIPLNSEEIMAKIIRHKYVNEDDMFELQIDWESKFGDSNLSITYRKEIDFKKYLVINSQNMEFLNFIKLFWTKLGLNFEVLTEQEILLSRNITVA
ncbi:hypothetical protein Q361_1336 [Flavobacterium croceum DSM 17960]|uniref:Uncharacterized protein n=1 Tax=Flavobacterium croceum DSM 17960 TaxID=1121886 RepID=A0A2S4N4M8_9FLAO|nr:hypothetical protein [Flavobacterium croceum]POS00667.1 hypothetical protein Q361_1336 [Flavobacterium croceum DSM 17960]